VTRGEAPPARPRWGPDPAAKGRRLFIAVPLPDAAVHEVAAIVDEVRSMPLPAGARDVRWVRLDGLHLTIRFLGPTPDERVAALVEAVEAVAASTDGRIELELARSGTFPAGRRPRVLWIGVEGATDALARLAAATEAALASRGWEPSERAFRAHLTLARSDGIAVAERVAGRLAAGMADRRIEAPVDRIGLFESITGAGPARYLPVAIRNFA
jgi:2'-5' RNA ligase